MCGWRGYGLYVCVLYLLLGPPKLFIHAPDFEHWVQRYHLALGSAVVAMYYFVVAILVCGDLYDVANSVMDHGYWCVEWLIIVGLIGQVIFSELHGRISLVGIMLLLLFPHFGQLLAGFLRGYIFFVEQIIVLHRFGV